MSFGDLKLKRQPKAAKSHVSALSGPSGLVPARSSPKVAPSAQDNTVADTNLQLPPSLEIKKTDRSGRGLWARQAFKPGSIILSAEPQVFVLSNQYLGTYCSSCARFASTSPFMRCSGCGTLRYCSASCQKADWNMHKPECSALQRWAGTAPSTEVAIPSDAVRCLGRILWQIKSEGLDGGWSKELQSMQSHKVSPQQPASVEAYTHLAHSVVRYLGLATPSDLGEYGIVSASDLVNTISRFITNTIALTSPSLTPIGVSVSPLVALTNHSCLPNAVVVFPRGKANAKEPIMTIIALRDIAVGEEVLMAYIDTTLPRAQRQKMLAETYNFTCECSLCNQPATIPDPREIFLCPKLCGGTCPLPNDDNPVSQCSTCHTSIPDPDAVVDAIHIGQEALDKATRLQSSNAEKAVRLTTNVIPILLSTGLPSPCHPLLALLKLHLSLCVLALSSEGVSQARLDECVRTAARHVAGVSAVLTEGHPVRGMALAELGKLLAVDEPSPQTTMSPSFPPSGPARLKLSYETLVKARHELLVGFGKANEGGEVGGEVRESIVAVERELGVWTTGVRYVLEDSMVRSSGKA